MANIIDLGVITKGELRNLSGVGLGTTARQMLKLDTHDLSADRAYVHAPENLRNISSTYVSELFGPSLIKLGSMQSFLAKYDLGELNERLRERIVNHLTTVQERQNIAA